MDRKLLHGKIRLLTLVLFVISLPFSKTGTNIATIILAINWIFDGDLLNRVKKPKNSFLLFCFCLPFILSIVGLTYTENMTQGFFELEKGITILLFPLIFSTSGPLAKNEVRIIFKAFILACVSASAICFVYAVYRNYNEGHTLSYVFNAIFFDIHLPNRYEYFNYYYFTYYFFSEPLGMHPIYLAMYTLFSSCMVIWLWWDDTKFNERLNWKLSMLLIYNFIVIILLSSRTQMFSLIVIGTIFILYYSYAKNILFKGSLLLLFLSLILFTLILLNPISRERFSKAISPTVHYTENQHGEGGLSLRLYKWKYTIEAIKDNFFFGTGPGDAQEVLQKVYIDNSFKIGYENELNPHNQYLQAWLELGLIGFLALIATLVLPIYFAYKESVWIYIVLILILAISFLTESMLELNKGIVFYTFFNSLFAFTFLDNKSKRNTLTQ